MSLKKYVLLLSFLSFLSFTYGQNVQDVSIKVCNDGLDKLSTRYTLPIEPGSSKDLCIYAENNSPETVKLFYTFPMAKLTDHNSQLCDVSTGFLKFFENKSDRILELAPGKNTTIKEKINVPLGMNGMQYGCLTYNVMKPVLSGAKKDMFEIVVRKAVFLNLFVGGKSNINNTIELKDLTGGLYSFNPKIKVELDKNDKMYLSFLIENKGNIAQDVSLSGSVYSFLGFQREFDGGKKRLMPGESIMFKAPAGVIPFYKGLFFVDVSVSAQPFFDFAVTGLDKSLTEPLLLEEFGRFIAFSWIWCIVLLVCVVLLWKIFFSKKKQVVVVSSSPDIQNIG